MLRKTFFEARPVLICEGLKIPNNERVPNKFYYDIRHGDDSVIPISIERNQVIVNHWGTLVADYMILSSKFPSLDLSSYYKRQFRFSGEEIYDQQIIRRILYSPITRDSFKKGEI
ncbi:LPD28 domain-containing protein [Paenibacillus agilis]|uniref:Large polyvalent protein associated domain-containing protein n=1 Tax=Paenibacillus agilis TaxID=3020863 RepID=A0A559ICZ5_9BACL|nr:LPD28 domain-containing protein [Paenibacillus agilis]TVX85551.1 hypothetical protein FPZ44_24655 [Paenibacillus agilis]